MRRIPFVWPIAAVLLFLVLVGATAPAYSQNAHSRRTAKVPGSKVYFVPIANFPAERLQRLADYYRQRFDLEITILKAISFSPATLDSRRGQLVAEKLIADMRDAFPGLAANPKAILIAFTLSDMYPLGVRWKYAFGWRFEDTRSAVVSSARMSLHYPGEPRSGTSSEIRLRKMVTKDIAILYYGLPQNNDPRSALYKNIKGIQELDAMGEEF
jgi:predicted Zn-dependent protease